MVSYGLNLGDVERKEVIEECFQVRLLRNPAHFVQTAAFSVQCVPGLQSTSQCTRPARRVRVWYNTAGTELPLWHRISTAWLVLKSHCSTTTCLVLNSGCRAPCLAVVRRVRYSFRAWYHASCTELRRLYYQHVEFKGKVLMDKTRKGVRAGRGPRAENQFWYCSVLPPTRSILP